MRRPDPWLLWFGGGAFFVCYLGQTVLGVIQPTIDSELGLSASEAQWVVNSYFLTLACSPPRAGGSATTTATAGC